MATFTFGSGSQGTARPTSVVGKMFASAFLSVFLAMGLLFCGLIAREVYRIGQTYTWKAVDCEVIACSVGDHHPYRLDIRYRYTWAGRPYESTKLRVSGSGEDDLAKAQALAERYQPGRKTTCYVNSANPAEAVLLRQTPWIGLFILLPLVFVAIGGGGIYYVWRQPAT